MSDPLLPLQGSGDENGLAELMAFGQTLQAMSETPECAIDESCNHSLMVGHLGRFCDAAVQPSIPIPPP